MLSGVGYVTCDCPSGEVLQYIAMNRCTSCDLENIYNPMSAVLTAKNPQTEATLR